MLAAKYRIHQYIIHLINVIHKIIELNAREKLFAK